MEVAIPSTSLIGIGAARIVAVRVVALLHRHQRATPTFRIILGSGNRIPLGGACINTGPINVVWILSPELGLKLASTTRFNQHLSL